MSPTDEALSLLHVIVAVGTTAEWAAADPAWIGALGDDLGKVADAAGVRWLTVRPATADHEQGASGSGDRRGVTVSVGECTVTLDQRADGKERLVEAAEACRLVGEPIDEGSLSARLNAPALVEPDLVVVVGQGHRLPVSLVWELAYSELVFFDISFAELSAAHLEDAISSYRHRHRRFGGVD